jgi:periplasmic protein CpxP/Spy
MKKVIIMFVAMFAFAATSFAQTEAQAAPIKEKKEKKAKVEGQAEAKVEAKKEGKPESWKSLLGLTAEQDAKMKEIGKAYKEKSEAIKNDATADKAQKKAKSAELKQTNEADLKAVLSAEQFTKYVEIQKQRKEEKEKAKQGEKAPEKN